MKKYNLSFECLVTELKIKIKQSLYCGLYYFYCKGKEFGYFFKAGETWFWFNRIMRRFGSLDELFKVAGAEIESQIR